MQEEKVTIIMPVYNPGAYLRPCLDSLLGQTFRDFRLIAIDDASTDGSGKVLKAYAEKDPRMLAWQNPYNLGAARTRNIGLQMAKGEYVVILDADDVFEPDYLETLYAACHENNLDIAFCDFTFRDEQTQEEKRAELPSYLEEKMCDIVSGQDLKDFCGLLFAAPFLKMYRRDFLVREALLFQVLQNSNDVFFSFAAYATAKRIQHIPLSLMVYRTNTGRQISTKRGEKPICAYQAYEKIYGFLKQRNLFEIFRKGFYSAVVDIIVYALQFVTDDKQEKFLAFLKNDGLPKLGTKSLQRTDFLSTGKYFVWQAIMNKERWNHAANEAAIEIETCYKRGRALDFDSFFIWAKEHHYNVAHWGYGKLGKEFCAEAKKKSFHLTEFYDRNPEKWDEKAIPPIRSYENHDTKTNLIVMTNAKFKQDILKQVGGEKVKILDLDSYMNLGISFEEAMIVNRDAGIEQVGEYRDSI